MAEPRRRLLLPAQAHRRPTFGEDATTALAAFYERESGYVDDPMLAHNLACAARHHGAEFRFREQVVEVVRAGGRAAGVRLASGTVAAPVVVNVGGPHSGIINAMAGVVGDMRIGHRPLRQEVFAVPGPARRGCRADRSHLSHDQRRHPMIAAELSAATGRQIDFVDVPDDVARHGMLDAGLPPVIADLIVATFALNRFGPRLPPK